MSESRSKLEEILELLLAEENEKAEEMLHEYVVAKARAEYEKVLDEDSSSDAEVEEEAVEEEADDMATLAANPDHKPLPAGWIADRVLKVVRQSPSAGRTIAYRLIVEGN